MMALLLGLGCFFLILFGYLAIKVYLNSKKLSYIPGIIVAIPPIPIFGPLIHPVLRDFQKFYFKLGEFVEKCGTPIDPNSNKNDMLRMTMWWARNSLVIQNADAIKQICVKKAKSYPKPENQYDAFNVYGRNILASNGEEWRRHRTLCNPAFNDEHLKHLCDVSVDTIKQLMARYEESMKKSSMNEVSIDVYTDMTLITFDIIGKAGFGYDMKIWEGKQNDFDSSKHTMSFKTALDIAAGDALFMRARYYSWVTKLPIPAFVRNHKGVEETEKYIREIIALRKQGGSEQQYDLLSLLTSSKDGELGVLNENEIISDSFIFLLAGHETTSAQLSWTLYRLAKHQEVQEKLRKEVDTVLQGRDPTYDDYKTLRYLNCIVKESMRMHPPVVRVGKVTDENDVIGKYNIPAKTGVIINVYAVHHDERYWDEPWEFKPERFDPQENPKGYNTFAFIPFSIGNRNCIGQHFSLMESCMMLAKIIQRYTIHFLPGTPADYTPDTASMITVRPKDLHLLLKKRL